MKKYVFLLGIFAAAIASLLMALARFAGLPMNMELMFGTTFGFNISPVCWVVGFVSQVVLGGLIALLYDWVFRNVCHRVSTGLGVILGFLHALISGLLLGLAPLIDRAMPGVLPPPGVFYYHTGPLCVLLFLVVHLVFGAIVGAGERRLLSKLSGGPQPSVLS